MKKWLRFSLAAALLAGFAGPARAAGDAEVFLVTVVKVEFKSVSGEWKTSYEGRLPLDLADPEASLQFDNQGKAPEGSYQNVRVTLDEAIQVKGRDGRSGTREGGVLEIRGTASRLTDLPGQVQNLNETMPTHTEDSPGLMKVGLDLDFADRDHVIEVTAPQGFEKAFSVKKDSKVSLNLRAPMTGTLEHVWPKYFGDFPAADVMMARFPSSLSEFSIKVDGATSFSKGPIAVDF